MGNKKQILSFPGQDSFTVGAVKNTGKYKNFANDAGSYIPVGNYSPNMAQQEIGITNYYQNVPPAILNPTGEAGGGGGGSIYHTTPDKILSTAAVTNTNSTNTKDVTTTTGGNITKIGSALTDSVPAASKKPFPWVPIVIGVGIIVALIGAKLLFTGKKSPAAV